MTKIKRVNKIKVEVAEAKQEVQELKGLAGRIAVYIEELRNKGIDIEYIKENAEQIRTIFFTAMEVLNGATEEGAVGEEPEEGTDDGEAEKENSSGGNGSAAGDHGRSE